MVEIEFKFPVESDAHKAHLAMSKFFQGSEVFKENYILMNPVMKNSENPDKLVWSFKFDISTGETDTAIEKYIDISGGLLNIMNGTREVWAFA